MAEADPHELPGKKTMRQLGAVEVRDLEGSPVRLDSLWPERPAALVFLRHYG